MSNPAHLAVLEGPAGSEEARAASPTGGIHHAPQRIDEREDLASHSRTHPSGGEVHRPAVEGYVRREHQPILTVDITSLGATTSHVVEGAGDGGPHLARTVIVEGMPPTPEDSPIHDYSPTSQAAIKALLDAVQAETPGGARPKLEDLPKTTILVGQRRQKYKLYTYLLTSKVPYFTKRLKSRSTTPEKEMAFEDLDEFAFNLFADWLYSIKLKGPTSFHSLHHYLSLYCIAFKWDVESLCNDLLDMVRTYYRINNMTAPAARIEYMYANTDGPNFMRALMQYTAAWRALNEAPIAKGVYLSDSMQHVVSSGGVQAVDFAEAILRLAREEAGDPRKGPNCDWHEHANGKYCPVTPKEPYQ